MKVQGTIFEVTNLQRFVPSYYLNSANPDPSTFQAVKDTRIHVSSITNMPSFFPSFSVKAESDSDGAFSIDTSRLPSNFDAYIIAYKKIREIDVPYIGKIPIYQPVYRSNKFSLDDNDISVKIYFGHQTIPDKEGISQDEITRQVQTFRDSMANVNKLSAVVVSNGISISGEGRGAEVTFNIKLKPYTGSKLNRFVKHEIEDFDIDLPGPIDLITTLCVDEDDIQQQINAGVGNMINNLNDTILDSIISEVAQSLGINANVIKNFFNQNITLTFGGFKFPVVETRKIYIYTIKRRAIVPIPYFGFPRNI